MSAVYFTRNVSLDLPIIVAFLKQLRGSACHQLFEIRFELQLWVAHWRISADSSDNCVDTIRWWAIRQRWQASWHKLCLHLIRICNSFQTEHPPERNVSCMCKIAVRSFGPGKGDILAGAASPSTRSLSSAFLRTYFFSFNASPTQSCMGKNEHHYCVDNDYNKRT